MHKDIPIPGMVLLSSLAGMEVGVQMPTCPHGAGTQLHPGAVPTSPGSGNGAKTHHSVLNPQASSNGTLNGVPLVVGNGALAGSGNGNGECALFLRK